MDRYDPYTDKFIRDTISRQAAIDVIGEKSDEIYKTKQKGATYPHDDFFQGMAYAENVVKQLPPIQPEPHWIPVTEQPPEVGKSVLICDADGDICLGHRTQCGYYYPDFCGDKIKNVTAWCELPEPYKGVTT